MQQQDKSGTTYRLDLITNILLPVPESERQTAGSLALGCAVLMLAAKDAMRIPRNPSQSWLRNSSRHALLNSPFLQNVGEALGHDHISEILLPKPKRQTQRAHAVTYRAGDSVVFKVALHNGSKVERGEAGTVQADGPSAMGFVSVMDGQGHTWLCKVDEIRPNRVNA